MPKKYRISHADFKKIEGLRLRRERGVYFALSHGSLPDGGHGKLQIACVISKGNAAKAACRNLIKRRFREAIRNYAANIKKPAVLIFYANKNAKTAAFDEIRKDVARLIERAEVSFRKTG